MNALKNRDTIAGLSRGQLGVGAWNPICSGQGNRADEVDGCYRQAEILDISEVTDAAYLMLKFGGSDEAAWGSVKVSGNIGVRYVKTQVESTGSLVYPTITVAQRVCAPATASAARTASAGYPQHDWLLHHADMLAFASGGSQVPTSLGSTAEQDVDHLAAELQPQARPH